MKSPYNSFGSQTETTTSAWATTLSATIPGRIHSVPKVQTTTATTATVAFVAPDMGGVPILGYTCWKIPKRKEDDIQQTLTY